MSLDPKAEAKLRKLVQDRLQKTGDGGCRRCGKLKEQQGKKHCNRCLTWFSERAKRIRLAKRFEKEQRLPSAPIKGHLAAILKAHEDLAARIAKLEADCSELVARVAKREQAKTFSKSIAKMEMKLESMNKRMLNAYKRGWNRGAKAARNYLEKPSPENFDPAQTDYDELQQISHVYQPQ